MLKSKPNENRKMVDNIGNESVQDKFDYIKTPKIFFKIVFLFFVIGAEKPSYSGFISDYDNIESSGYLVISLSYVEIIIFAVIAFAVISAMAVLIYNYKQGKNVKSDSELESNGKSGIVCLGKSPQSIANNRNSKNTDYKSDVVPPKLLSCQTQQQAILQFHGISK